MTSRDLRSAIQKPGPLVLIAITIAAGWFRLTSYGDLRRSVGNGETRSYIESSLAPAFSWNSWAGRRLLTTNLLYKLANDPAKCPLTAVSNPAEGDEALLTWQPCFDKIVLVQHLLAVLSWSAFAVITARRLRHPAMRISASVVILGFAFTPQIAEWDSVLSPESLSVSLFVLCAALLAEVSFSTASASPGRNLQLSTILLGCWLITFGLWVFLRDVHLYAVIPTIPVIAWIAARQRSRQFGPFLVAMVTLVAVLVVGYLSARASLRSTRFPLVNAFEDYVLPFPARVEFFRQRGMPDPQSDAYMPWLDRNAADAYTAFLLSHPGFVLGTLWEHLGDFRTEYLQQYHEGDQTRNRAALIRIGEMLHPETNAVYLVAALLIAALGITARRGSDERLRAWIPLVGWIVLTSVIVLLASYFGDANAIRRHLYPSVESMRLLMWLVLFVVLDSLVANPERVEADNHLQRLGP